MAAGPGDQWVTGGPNARPYGIGTQGAIDRTIGSITSPFTYEQVGAITTSLIADLLGQREVIFVDPRGPSETLAARVREYLWERCIRSPYTSWAPLMWMTYRDVVVHSRAWIEVRYLKIERMRRQYAYADPAMIEELLNRGVDPEVIAEMVGAVRTSTVGLKTIWQGPVLLPMAWGSVHKPPCDPFLTDLSAYVAIEREAPYQEFMALAKQMFSPPAIAPGEEPYESQIIVPFDETECQQAAAVAHEAARNSQVVDANPSRGLPAIYGTIRWAEFKGADPLGNSGDDIVAWSVGGRTIGAKGWDGSGSPITAVEFVIDPINGYQTSVGPALAIRAYQEMLTLLGTARLGQALWDGYPAGITNPMVISARDMQKLRPGRFVDGKSDGAAVDWVQKGRNAAASSDLIDRVENSGRNATAGQGSVVGMAPPGVGSATEYAGVSQGSLGRLDVQKEINSDCAVLRAYRLVQDLWRDNIASDEQLQEILGDNEDVQGAKLQHLDKEMDAIPMAARYKVVNERELRAITAIKTAAATSPTLLARLKPEIDDDFVQAAAGARGWRWVKTQAEVEADLAAKGLPPTALKDAEVENAVAGGPTVGQPSPPSPVEPTPAGQMGQ